ncbi:hypothetical protein FKM82_008779 [Ascaphus truei]
MSYDFRELLMDIVLHITIIYVQSINAVILLTPLLEMYYVFLLVSYLFYRHFMTVRSYKLVGKKVKNLCAELSDNKGTKT